MMDEWHERFPLRAGIERSDARRATGLPAALADAVIDDAVHDARLRVVDGLIARRGFVPRPDGGQAAALERLAAAYAAAGLAAPRAEDLPPDLGGRADLRDLLAVLVRHGGLRPGYADRQGHAHALEQAAIRLVAGLGGRTGLTPADFRDLFDLPRKHLIPLLELFDRLGWTRREGDLRSVAQKSAEIPHPVP